MERPATIALLHRFVHGDALIKHGLATGAVMKAVAGFLLEDPARSEKIGILHDIDFEYVKGDMQQHRVTGALMLKTTGLPEEICNIVRRHNHFLYTGTYDRPVEIAFRAADSASGLIIAWALIKDGRLFEVSVKTVTRKAKEKSFSAGCGRNRIALITPFREIAAFYEFAFTGMMKIRAEPGLE